MKWFHNWFHAIPWLAKAWKCRSILCEPLFKSTRQSTSNSIRRRVLRLQCSMVRSFGAQSIDTDLCFYLIRMWYTDSEQCQRYGELSLVLCWSSCSVFFDQNNRLPPFQSHLYLLLTFPPHHRISLDWHLFKHDESYHRDQMSELHSLLLIFTNSRVRSVDDYWSE